MFSIRCTCIVKLKRYFLNLLVFWSIFVCFCLVAVRQTLRATIVTSIVLFYSKKGFKNVSEMGTKRKVCCWLKSKISENMH